MSDIFKLLRKQPLLILLLTFLVSCGDPLANLPGGSRDTPVAGRERAKKNLEEGRGFTLNKAFGNGKRGGTFDFASSNELWRASLDVIDFMPLTSVNYSGGIIITDWYNEKNSSNESIKISIRFLTNEIRSDALDIKIFNRKCINSITNCNVTNIEGNLVNEIKKEILKKAAIYKSQRKEETINQNKDWKYPNTDGKVF